MQKDSGRTKDGLKVQDDFSVEKPKELSDYGYDLAEESTDSHESSDSFVADVQILAQTDPEEKYLTEYVKDMLELEKLAEMEELEAQMEKPPERMKRYAGRG